MKKGVLSVWRWILQLSEGTSKKFWRRAHVGSRCVSPSHASCEVTGTRSFNSELHLPMTHQLGLLLMNLCRAFVSASFLLSKQILVWITVRNYKISFVSFKKASVISPASAAYRIVCIFQQKRQIVHTESSILVILEFIHRKIKTPD